MKVVALAGGVGGAKLAHGLAQVLPAQDISIIVNTGDDFEHFGLHVSPDVDTVCYTLAGIADPQKGWGLAGDTWTTLGAIERLRGPTWFQVGDRDWATHLERTRRLREGQSLSKVTSDLCAAWGIQQTILPMTDDPVRTVVRTASGDLAFQEYFVHQRCKPVVQGFIFSGVDAARPAPGVIEALRDADVVVVCPSNPWVSIAPVLSVQGIRAAIDPAKSVAVSPIVGGRAIKGPAAKMYAELGIQPSAFSVAEQYKDLVRNFVIDEEDRGLEPMVSGAGMRVLVTSTIMQDTADRVRLAASVIDFVGLANQ